MHKNHSNQLRRKILATAIASTLGIATTGLTSFAIADTYVWGSLSGVTSSADCAANTDASPVIFTMLDSGGGALGNTSITAKGANSFQTPTCGTFTYDTASETGTANIAQFDFFKGSSPAVAAGITFKTLTNAEGGGNDGLLLANMLFDWNGTVGIPVSIAWDANFLLSEMDGTPSGTYFTIDSNGAISGVTDMDTVGSAPASDGTYVGVAPIPGTANVGGFAYLALGPAPLSTTAFNTTTDCTPTVDCMSEPLSGILPLIVDTVPNAAFDTANTGGTIGGSPMVDGPFSGNNANFDFTRMKLISYTDETIPAIALAAHTTPAGTSPLSLTLGVDTYTEPGATCTDAAPVGGNPAVTIGGDTVDPNFAGVYTVTYDCTDTSGNLAAQVTREIIVCGPGAPCVALVGNNPVTQECALPYADAGAICVDGLDGDILLAGNGTDPGTFALDVSGVNVATPSMGTDTATYNCTDSDSLSASLSRTVNIVDSTNPVITITGGDEEIVSSTLENIATYVDKGATATDSCDLTAIGITTTNNVDLIVPDTGLARLQYSVTYDAMDASTNPDSKFRTVGVTRSQPVITLNGSSAVVLSVGALYDESILGMDVIDAQDIDATNITSSTVGCLSGGFSDCVINSSAVNTNVKGTYQVTYDATDSAGNKATQVSRTVTVGAFAENSNFSMLDTSGAVFGGTNDVVFDWDGSSLNTDETDTNFGLMTISSAKPQPFFNFLWTAHHIRIYGPGTYSFDTTCSAAQYDAGTTNCGGTNPITMTVPAGHFGGHILFDWGKPTASSPCGVANCDIDVVNVWQPDGVWDQHGDSDPRNQLFAGASGVAPDPTTTWKLVSTDVNGDGVNASPMVDGPFQGFYANFNAGPGATAGPTVPLPHTQQETELGDSPLASMNILGLFAGLLSILGLRRINRKK